MKTRLQKAWDALRTSFWFLPAIMVVAAALLALGALEIDHGMKGSDGVPWLGWQFSQGPEGSRALLSVVAGSMMTITSITFSITIVTLQLASSQFGPHLLRHFMRDRANQLVLGTFISTFTYSLLVLREVNGTDGSEFVPHVAMAGGMLLTLLSLGILIYFIHHVAESIQAESVIANVSCDLRQAVERLYPERMGHGTPRPEPAAAPGLPDGFERSARVVPAPNSDYVQAVDDDTLMDLARRHDLVVRLEVRPGEFVIEGAALARVWPGSAADEVVEAIGHAVLLGSHRTLIQDVRLAVDQLVEIALRALSPGINDPFTAINCIDRLGEALRLLLGREIPSAQRLDDEGRLRVMAARETFATLIDAAFDPIRQSARTHAALTIRLLETLAAVAAQCPDGPERDALRRHADRIVEASRLNLDQECDRHAAERQYREVLRNCGAAAD